MARNHTVDSLIASERVLLMKEFQDYGSDFQLIMLELLRML